MFYTETLFLFVISKWDVSVIWHFFWDCKKRHVTFHHWFQLLGWNKFDSFLGGGTKSSHAEPNTNLFLVLPPGGVQRLNECSCMTHKHGEAGSAHNHAEDGEPHVSHADGRVQAVSDAQHVTHGFEQGVGVLLTPGVVLWGTTSRKDKVYQYQQSRSTTVSDFKIKRWWCSD